MFTSIETNITQAQVHQCISTGYSLIELFLTALHQQALYVDNKQNINK